MKKNREFLKSIISMTLVTGFTFTLLPITTKVNAKPINTINCENINRSSSVDKLKQIDSIREKWKEDLTGGKNINLKDPNIKSKVDSIDATCSKLISTINKDKNGKWLWNNCKEYKTNPAQITNMYKNLLAMAKAYNIVGSKYYKDSNLKNEIIKGLDWVYKNAYNENTKEYGNWWHWLIGAPQTLGNTVVLMHDDLSKEQINNYMNAVQKFIPTIDLSSRHCTGANLADIDLTKLLQGLNLRDENKIKEASEKIVGIFDYVKDGDNPNGFYEDGSFIQHNIIAYTGSYGSVILGKAANILYILEGTPWAVQSQNKKNMYNWIFKSFDPIIYKGYVMDMVKGRSISRPQESGFANCGAIIEGITRISLNSDENNKNKMKSLIKSWYKDSNYDFQKHFGSLKMIEEFNGIINDSSVKPYDNKAQNFELNNMDRTVHRRQDFTFAIKRSSNRISKYEYMNGENRNPWFQGDGATYLYDDDYKQYANNYWPTVDQYRLPGTTVEKKNRGYKKGNDDSSFYELGLNKWSGGTSLDSYGVSGMTLKNKHDNLEANKSWFMFDNEIVALGSNINTADNFDVETTIENKVLNKAGDNDFIVDNKLQSKDLNYKENLKDSKWAYIKGNENKKGTGYYFPDGGNIKALREKRTGKWSDINKSIAKTIDSSVKENNYLTLYFDHGKSPKNQSYSYVILPNKNSKEVEKYAKNPDIIILQNNKDIQAVKNTKLNITCGNFFGEKNQLDGLTVNGKASIILKENNDGTLEIAVSDPTFEEKNIGIEINKEAEKVVSNDSNINNIKLGKSIKFNVNTEKSHGKTFKLVVKLKK